MPLPTKPSCRPGRKNSVQLLHGFQFLVLHGKLHMRKCNNSERVCMRGGRGRKKAAVIFKLSGFSSLRSDLIGICKSKDPKAERKFLAPLTCFEGSVAARGWWLLQHSHCSKSSGQGWARHKIPQVTQMFCPALGERSLAQGRTQSWN